MTEPILVAVAPDGDAHDALQLAVSTARLLDRPLVLGGVAVLSDFVPAAPVVGAFLEALEPGWLLSDTLDRLEELRAALPHDLASSVVAVSAPTVGMGFEKLVRTCSPRLVVLGATHRGVVQRTVHGDDALHAVRDLTCPVLLAALHPSDRVQSAAPRVVGVGWDRSEESDDALVFGADLAQRGGAELRILHVLEPVAPLFLPPADPQLGRELASTRRRQAVTDIQAAVAALRPDCTVQIDVREGSTGMALESLSSSADLMVIGSRQAGVLHRLLAGSVSERLAHHAHCPLLIVPHGAAAPVAA